ncbi:hypothetical protein [Pseudomonas saponiphila]|uniref:hypothetical protein n=1 Tax=Pseudomonas saponiphila TaxID=556534 RepID=UPI003905C107
MKSKTGGLPAYYRLAVALRVCAAVLGGYLLAATGWCLGLVPSTAGAGPRAALARF